jgi:site-specific DNA-cytosine methylase
MQEFTILHVYCGLGGAALGAQQAISEYRGMVGKFRTLCGIDCDPESCADFEVLTGAPAVHMDLFSRDDYTAFHGHEPDAGWQEVSPDDLLTATGGEYPDVVFLSPPCKGFSALLPKKRAKSNKYQALNRLTLRGIDLVLQAYQDDLPAVFLIENVPRIKSRGKTFLHRIKGLLSRHGYEFFDSDHDCGEIGGLAQHRKRYLLIARNRDKVPNWIFQPPKKTVRPMKDVIAPLPMPDDPGMGELHRLPRLQWKTWMRLALIPAGGDWRDLEDIPFKDLRLKHTPRDGVFQVAKWNEPCRAIIGHARPGGSNGVAAVADPRTGFKANTHTAIYSVCDFNQPARTVTGALRPNNGAICINDPRLNCKPRSGSYGVLAWDKPSSTVIGSDDIHAGSSAVAEPRIAETGFDTGIPKDREPGKWVIISQDGTWHRPLTTLELAALQGLPVILPDGRPLQLAGNSDARWRERIGNAVPPPAMKAIAEQLLDSLLVSKQGDLVLGNTGLWVREDISRGQPLKPAER